MCLDGNSVSQTHSFFSPKKVDTTIKKDLEHNIHNMRGSHFSIGKQNPPHAFVDLLRELGLTNTSYMQPAPYKISHPESAEKIKAIDGVALRKESWILG